MALSQIQSESMNLADDYTFTGTVSGASSPDNLVVNGAMEISQRGSSFTGFGAAVNYGLDRFGFYHSSDGAFTVSQETSIVPTDFTHALKVLITTADASIAAGQRLILFTKLEGNRVSHLNWGTSDAKAVTLSFWVRSSVTGTHGGAFGNGSDNRNYPFTYTISTADTWERKTITVAGDQTGTWATDNTNGLQIVWGLGVGSTYSGSAGAWAAGDKNSATGATTSVLGTTNATWYLTGVQLETGSNASDFHHRSYADTIRECLRYYYRIERNNAWGEFMLLRAYSTTNGTCGAVQLPVPMRASPTLSCTSPSGNFAYSVTAITGGTADALNKQMEVNVTGAFTANGAAVIQKDNNSDVVYIDFTAEL